MHAPLPTLQSEKERLAVILAAQQQQEEQLQASQRQAQQLEQVCCQLAWRWGVMDHSRCPCPDPLPCPLSTLFIVPCLPTLRLSRPVHHPRLQ